MKVFDVAVPCALFMAGWAHAQAQDTPAIIRSGIDTLAPVISDAGGSCSVRQFVATELRNIPDPPAALPEPRDQVETGISAVRFLENPRPDNIELVLSTSTSFPRDGAFRTFAFEVRAIDPSRRASALVEVTDWAGNRTVREVRIDPASLRFSERPASFESRPGRPTTDRAVVVNETSIPISVTEISVPPADGFVILNPPALPFQLAPGASTTITVQFTPTLSMEGGLGSTLAVRTNCGVSTLPVNGKALVARLRTNDWDADTVPPQQERCNPTGVVVENTGNTAVTISTIAALPAGYTATPSLPVTIPAGGSAQVSTLCFTLSDIGPRLDTIRLTADIDDGDLDCVVSVVINDAVSVQDAAMLRGTSMSDGILRFSEPTSVTIVDLRGALVRQMSNVEQFNTKELMHGVYGIVVHGTNSQRFLVSVTE